VAESATTNPFGHFLNHANGYENFWAQLHADGPARRGLHSRPARPCRCKPSYWPPNLVPRQIHSQETCFDAGTQATTTPLAVRDHLESIPFSPPGSHSWIPFGTPQAFWLDSLDFTGNTRSRPVSMARLHQSFSGCIQHEVRTVEPRAWPFTPVRSVMRSADNVHFVSRDLSADAALQIMGREDVNQLPVMSDGRVEGIVSRAHLLQVLRSRAELELPPSLPRAA
jgi:CBS domain-containing protein